MKKVILALTMLAVSGASYAFCPSNVDKIYGRIQSHGVTAITITNSPDEATWASDIQKGLEAKGIKVTVVSAQGTGICKIKPTSM